jgi:hypothetical protein
LPSRRGSGSKILHERLENPPKDRSPGYAADLAVMHGLITEGRLPRCLRGEAVVSLKARYPKEHAEL